MQIVVFIILFFLCPKTNDGDRIVRLSKTRSVGVVVPPATQATVMGCSDWWWHYSTVFYALSLSILIICSILICSRLCWCFPLPGTGGEIILVSRYTCITHHCLCTCLKTTALPSDELCVKFCARDVFGAGQSTLSIMIVQGFFGKSNVCLFLNGQMTIQSTNLNS